MAAGGAGACRRSGPVAADACKCTAGHPICGLPASFCLINAPDERRSLAAPLGRRLSDLVGADVGLHVGKNILDSFPERSYPARIIQARPARLDLQQGACSGGGGARGGSGGVVRGCVFLPPMLLPWGVPCHAMPCPCRTATWA